MIIYPFPGSYFVVEDTEMALVAGIKIPLLSDGQNTDKLPNEKVWFKNMCISNYDEVAAVVHCVDENILTHFTVAEFIEHSGGLEEQDAKISETKKET